MCGIVGFTGHTQAAPMLLSGLAKLEYRGYDSAGIAVINNDRLTVKKTKGPLQTLSDLIDGGRNISGTTGIGHTRWATHGKPSDENAHPHKSQNGKFAIVHNGIIENYATLRELLKENGYKFVSETDTEVVAHLLEYNYNGDTFETIVKTMEMLEGAFALGILNLDYKDEFFAVRRSSPLIVGLSDQGNMIASDIPAVLSVTRKIKYLNDNEIVKLTADSVEIFDCEHNSIDREITEITWDVSAAEKGGYDHFMIKEIMEQPTVLRDTISPFVKDGNVLPEGLGISDEMLKNIDRINIVACGSAYHAGYVGKYVIEALCRVPVMVDVASEFRYNDPIINENSLVIIISQSGETADTLAALREAKSRGAKTLSIVNVVGSSIANESDHVLYTLAGPEIAVATTKAYSSQVAMLYLIAMHIAKRRGNISDKLLAELIKELHTLPQKVAKILESAPQIELLAQRYAYLDHAYFIGRNLDYAVALEASLKLKEISYIHSEAYAAGELKHGTISLIEEGTFVVGLACSDRLMSKTISNIKEVKARGAEVLVLACENTLTATQSDREIDHILTIPTTHELLLPTLEVIPMQLLGYYIAKARNCNIDKPRNLAKSVTVE